ncbi:alpha-D-ribose 1-methylphosphonate 5-triphosphate diphosphatase [Sulfitobacter guttiformis]|uniref:Alpha-D-ribose 1-methylphosphonate 5-triphosphate diphosphatase n=1 Tax=Sulfitobacter guttiformis TaxID=74349 RepID=A0A420DTK1_9RHOB|nr:alpha-D-ribose 1-methylphosphonate 5-triphosphate diphosphatase [Sulfitobacter guttiformis]KIN71024.1 Phosphonate metabolism protein PhnM [Sulfitobacter guttiformis KCTC 32187]RKE97508.1 alpha-D-ribose 1-methylphosphonate 5-triphosphate diphosphatase [Sulfitobacter guttiformis]
MTNQTILANARLILETEIVTGSVVMEGGFISEINSGSTVPKGGIDLQGDYLAPGLVELHTDNLERHLSPRPRVDWPYRAAILAHDRELAGTGITTVFDAIRVGSIVSGSSSRYGKYARRMADEILAVRAAGMLRISHHIHLRAEICSETLAEELAEFTPEDRIGIVSMMDHTPGQRQFADLSKFETYVRGKYSFGDQEFRDYVDFLYGLQDKFGTRHEAATVSAATRLGAALASHDDTTARQVAASHAYGVTLAEFPTTVAAADACHAQGIATIMGAPNLIRGGSHSGNVAAADLARVDRLDILSSDYVPAGLLMAAVQLGDIWDDLPRGMATVTSRPAAAVGLKDRGSLSTGKRGDVIRFSILEDTPILQETWSAGARVF